MVKHLLCGTKISLMCTLFLSAFLVSTITSVMAESTPSRIKVTKTCLLDSKLFTQQDVLETIVNQINETRFKCFDSVLCDIGPRRFYSTSNKLAAEFIAKELNATKSISATYQWFTIHPTEIANVIGVLPSANPNNQSKIVIGAHFDTVSSSPGADDDGSGVAVLLEVAKVLSQFKFNCAIEFVAFNAEEEWMKGSNYYAIQALRNCEDIKLMINIDMCIWDNPNASVDEKLWIVYDEWWWDKRCERFADVALNIRDTYTKTPIQKISNTNNTYFDVKHWQRGDHASFWDTRVPALWISEFNPFQNPYYHKATDTIDAVGYNFTLGAHVAKLVAATVAKLAKTRILLGSGWGGMQIEPKEYVWGTAELYKVGEMQIELMIITYKGEQYSRTWDIVRYWSISRKHRYRQMHMQTYLCYSEEWGHALVRISDREWRCSWSCLGRGVWAFGLT